MLTALLVCLIPTTIGALLSAIGIAGMDRLVQRNVLATSGRAVEAAGDVDTLLLDKTGTITFGNRRATELIPAPGVRRGGAGRGRPAVQPGRPDAGGPQHRRAVRRRARACRPRRPRTEAAAEFVPFTAQTRMSGLDVDGRAVRKGAGVRGRCVAGRGAACPTEVTATVDRIADEGGTPLVVAEQAHGQRAGARRDPSCPTWSSPAWPSGSPSCARWASARS